MIGNLLGLKEESEKRRLLDNLKAIYIMGIFFEDWYSLREASKIYNPDLSSDKRNDRVVAYYFYKFKSFYWLEDKIITKKVYRKSKLGRKSIYSSKCKRYRLNFEPYIAKYHTSMIKLENDPKKKVLISFLEKNRHKFTSKIDKSMLGYISLLSNIDYEVNKKFNKLYR